MLRTPQLSSNCLACFVPFKGPLALITRFRGVSRSQQNPNLCNRCESHLAVGELHPVTVITLDFADSVGFGRIRLESLSQRELPAVRTKLISLLEQRGALVLPAEASPNGVVQACFNAPVRLDDPLRSGFDALNSAFAWIQDEAIATGLNYPLRAAITKGYVEIFGEPNTNYVCPIGHVTFRAPQLLRYASTGQIVADPQVAVELGFSAQPDEKAAVIFDQNRSVEDIQNRFPPLPVWSFSFLSQLSGVAMALLAVPCAAMVVAAPGAAALGLASVFAALLPLWKGIGMSLWPRLAITAFAVVVASVNWIRTELAMRRFRLLQRRLGYPLHLPGRQQLQLRLIRITSVTVLALIGLEGVLRVMVMKMPLL